MPVLYEPANPDFYREIKDRNLEHQYYFLETAVKIGLSSTNYKPTLDVLFGLHYTASMFLEDTPGKIRTDSVHIQNSDHIPPLAEEIPSYLIEYFQYLVKNFESDDAFHLAAYAFWRLTWIHPFEGCNGRTARAFCYMIISMKLGFMPPGRQDIIGMMSKEFGRSYELLNEADEAYRKTGKINVDGLSRYLRRLTLAQLT